MTYESLCHIWLDPGGGVAEAEIDGGGFVNRLRPYNPSVLIISMLYLNFSKLFLGSKKLSSNGT